MSYIDDDHLMMQFLASVKLGKGCRVIDLSDEEMGNLVRLAIEQGYILPSYDRTKNWRTDLVPEFATGLTPQGGCRLSELMAKYH